MYTNDYLYSIKDYEDKTLYAIIYAVQNGFDVNMLTRRYREKLNNLFAGGNKIMFSSKTAEKVIKLVLSHYLIKKDFACFGN